MKGGRYLATIRRSDEPVRHLAPDIKNLTACRGNTVRADDLRKRYVASRRSRGGKRSVCLEAAHEKVRISTLSLGI